jgi:hypothetical protein
MNAPASPAPPPVETAPAAPDWTNPYVGPRSFDLREALFYGRDREARELTSLLTARRVVVLHSPAGAGKTSLIQAALVPALEKRGFDVLPVIRVSLPVGGIAGNRYALSALLSLERRGPGGSSGDLPALANTTLTQYLDRRVRADDGESLPQVLIFDQFEEVLTLDPTDEPVKLEFFAQLEELLDRDRAAGDGRATPPPRWALFAIREEYLGAIREYLRGLPTGGNSTFRLDLLDRAGALDAIRRPAAERNVPIPADAAERLVDNLGRVQAERHALDRPLGSPVVRVRCGRGEYVEPVQLQVVCYRLWEKLAEKKTTAITPEVIDKLADVDNALAGYYRERVLRAAKETGTKVWDIRNWFETALITRGGVRAVVELGAEGERGLPALAVKHLENSFLIRREERRGMVWLELAHDRLIDPVLRDNRDALTPGRWLLRFVYKRRFLLVCFGLFVFAGLFLWALYWRQYAEKKQQEAEDQRGKAESSAAAAEFQRIQAEAASAAAEVQKKKAVDAAEEARRSENNATGARVVAEFRGIEAERRKDELAGTLQVQIGLTARLLDQLATRASRLATATDRDTVLVAGSAWEILYGYVWTDGPPANSQIYRALAAYLKTIRDDPRAVGDLPRQRELSLDLAHELRDTLDKVKTLSGKYILTALRGQYYEDAVRVAKRLADRSIAGLERAELTARFWELYWVKLAIVESRAVEGRMYDLGEVLKPGTADPPTEADAKRLAALAELLEKDCRRELAANRLPAL